MSISNRGLFCCGKLLTLYFDQTLCKPCLYMIRLGFDFFKSQSVNFVRKSLQKSSSFHIGSFPVFLSSLILELNLTHVCFSRARMFQTVLAHAATRFRWLCISRHTRVDRRFLLNSCFIRQNVIYNCTGILNGKHRLYALEEIS